MTDGTTEERAGRVATRRTALASVGTTLLATAAGCSGLTGSSSGGTPGGASPTGTGSSPTGTGSSPTGTGPLSGEWETTTEGDASATVVSGGLSDATLRFRVFRCSDASATAALGAVEGAVAISFDYTTRAENWWEVPYLQVREDGSVAYSSGDDEEMKIRRAQAAERSGSAETTVEVDGETAVRFGLRPSRKCENANHQNTYFTVEGLTIERA